MEINLSTTNILIILAAVGIIIFLVSVFKKVIRIVLILLVIIGLAYYLFVFSNIFKGPGEHTKYSIDNLKQKYCSQINTHSDSLKCFIVVTPIYNDIKSRYTNEELLELEKNPVEYFKILNKAIKRNKKDILKNLAKNKEQEIWDNFINDLKHKYPKEKIAE